MPSILFRILGLFFLVWVFQRVLSLFLGASKSNRAKDNSAGASNHMVKDPVCGMYMDSRLAVRLDRKSEEFYFCSEECRQKYLNNSAGSGDAGSAASR
jgi:YHS domain-containing protein